LESQFSLSALIQVILSQTYDKRTFRGVALLHFVLTELRPENFKSVWFHLETPSCRTATNLTIDGRSAEAQAFECLNGTHMLLLFSLVKTFIAKGMYLKVARLGFEPERPVTQS
jgi:hypothetical protein